MLLIVAALACREHGAARPPAAKLSPGLRRALASSRPDDKLPVMVDLATQLDLDSLGAALRRQGLGRLERRRVVVTALRRVAEQGQAPLRPVLERLKRRGAVDSYRGVAVVNRFIVVATAAGIRALAERGEVAAVIEETAGGAEILAGGGGGGGGGVLRRAPRGRSSWALTAIGADRAWKQGLDGRGVVVGLIDAGASAAHEQLKGNFRGGDGAWYDPSGRAPTPRDGTTGHGTTLLSVAVGRNVRGLTVGVAPGARWVACAGVPGGRYDNIALTECADWMLDVAQPDVLLNAWVLPTPGCDRSLARIVDAWRAAEILPVFAAGNNGPAAPSDASPANYAFSVGGVTRRGTAYPRSGRGPNSCDASIYPSVVAPAEDVPAAFPLAGTTYIRANGTSVAAAVTAGAAALLLQRFPEASVSQLERALRAGARDLGPPGPDNTFGYGLLSVPGALAALAR